MRRLLSLTALLTLGATASAQAIVGGSAAQRPYPHMGALYNDGEFYCGSSLVHARWVLTAAHCVEGAQPTDYTVQLGTAVRSSGGQSVKIVRGIVHEHYDADTAVNDLALLELAQDVSFAPIRVAGPGDEPLYAPSTAAIAIGWGATQANTGFETEVREYPPTDELREVQIPIRSESDCEVNGVVTGSYDGDVMLCAGETTGGKDTCYGDSGGPLMAHSGAAPVQVGVTSFGFGCGVPAAFGVYARLIALQPWVESKLPAPSGSPPAPPTGGQPQPAPGQNTSPQDNAVRIFLPARVGSARKARRTRRIVFTVRASGPVHGARFTLKRGRRVVGRGSVARIVGRARVRVRVNRFRVKPGRLALRVSARDGQGRAVAAARRVRLSR